MPVYKRNVASINKTGSSALGGAVTLTGGTNVTLTQSGQDISIAAASGSSGTAFRIGSSNFTTTSTANPPTVAVTNMSFAIASTETQSFEINLSASSSTTAGARLAFSIPASATIEVSCVSGLSSYNYDRISAGNTSTTVVFGTLSDTTAHLRGTVTTAGTSGTVQLLAGKVTSGTLTLYGGSYIVARTSS